MQAQDVRWKVQDADEGFQTQDTGAGQRKEAAEEGSWVQDVGHRARGERAEAGFGMQRWDTGQAVGNGV